VSTFWRPVPDGALIAVRVTPRARRAGLGRPVATEDGPRLALSVTEPPEDGRATEAARALLARALAVPPSAVSLRQGAASRRKLLHVRGDPAQLAARLAAL
jgi:hypothetical protein